MEKTKGTGVPPKGQGPPPPNARKPPTHAPSPEEPMTGRPPSPEEIEEHMKQLEAIPVRCSRCIGKIVKGTKADLYFVEGGAEQQQLWLCEVCRKTTKIRILGKVNDSLRAISDYMSKLRVPGLR